MQRIFGALSLIQFSHCYILVDYPPLPYFHHRIMIAHAQLALVCDGTLAFKPLWGARANSYQRQTESSYYANLWIGH